MEPAQKRARTATTNSPASLPDSPENLHGETDVVKDASTVFISCKRAADRGDPDAMVRLGDMFRYGQEGVAKDVPAAVELYKQAADLGDVAALGTLEYLGFLLEYGEDDVEKDVPAAVELYKQAADRGSVHAMVALGDLLACGGEGVEKDLPAAVELYKQAADRGYALAMVRLGDLLARGGEGVEKDVPAAMKLWRQAADRGHTSALYDAANCFELGEDGFEKDVPAAVELYRQAADRGSVHAMVALGHLLARGGEGVEKDVPAAMKLWRQAADRGNTYALYNVAWCFELGEEGVEKDVPAAVELYKLAAERGDAYAMVALGDLLARGGEGVEKDVPAAMKLWRQAADRGRTYALYNAANCFELGKEGVEKDVPAAVELYKLAAERGDTYAMVALGDLLARGGEGVEKDVPAAMKLWRQAADRGRTSALYNAANCFELGTKGVEKDVPAAVELYKQAADRGDAFAMVRLGLMLQNGEGGFAKDAQAAVALFRKLAELGNADAMYSLAVLLVRGEGGVAKDVTAAVALFRKSAKLGNADATNNLMRNLMHGIPTGRDHLSQHDVDSVLELREKHAFEISNISDDDWMNWMNKTYLAKLLLSPDVSEVRDRDPVRAARLLEGALQQIPTYGPALHELAILYSTGDEGVPQNRQRSAYLHSVAASKASYEGVQVHRADRIVIEAGEKYADVVEDIVRKGSAKPKTCLLLTLGGGGRGKTCTMNSLRGLAFVKKHEPTDMAALSKFVIEPGVRGVGEEVIAEYDFNENSLRANASRLHKEVVPEVELLSRNVCSETAVPLEVVQIERSSQNGRERQHADVTERVRRSLLREKLPVRFKGSVVQVWDMAGQSQYEMAHSMVIARGSILVFVTDLERVAEESTRESEVGLLCYWMQLAHILVPDPRCVRAVIVGTRKGRCGEDTIEILKDCVVKQLAERVYNSWIKKPLGARSTMDISKFIAIENSEALKDPKESGLEELERAVKRAGDEVVGSRGAVPLRWLAFVDKLERESRNCARIYLSREEVGEVSVEFPGFAKDEDEREKDVLEGLRCFASMGRLVLFEHGEEEWYLFLDVQKIIELVGKVTAPEERLRECLSAEDVRGLKQGRISQSALFALWDGYEEEEKKLMLKLLCKFDLLMLLEGGEACIGKDCVTVGVPALMRYGWDDFKWGRGAGEKDLEVTTKFVEALPNGLMGSVVAHLHRTLAVDESKVHGTSRRPAPMVRADAVLLSARDGSRVFVGFKRAERELCWRFRGKRPVSVAQECIREVEDLLNPRRVISVERRHFVCMNCDRSKGGCGASESVVIELSRSWICGGRCNVLPEDDVYCEQCRRPWSNVEIRRVVWGGAVESAVGLDGMQPVMTPRRYEVFISHAGPDKLTVAKPLYEALEGRKVHTFLDMEGLQINEDTAAEAMERAMGEACIGIFILSPEFAGREWTLKELRHFLERNKACKGDGVCRPVLLPVFYRLSISGCWTVYSDESEHQEVLRKCGFLKDERQAKCSVEEAKAALQGVTEHSGVEVRRIGGGEDLSSAAVVAETVRRVVDYMQKNGLK